MKKATILSNEEVYHGFFTINEEHIDLGHGETETREVLHTTDSATILLIDDQTNRVYIQEEYRAPIGKYCWDLPAGRVDYSEDPAETARRELAEETGYLVNPQYIRRYDKVALSHGVMDEQSNIYIAHLVENNYQIIPKKLDNDEFIKAHKWVSLNSALRQTTSAASHLAITYQLINQLTDELNQDHNEIGKETHD